MEIEYQIEFAREKDKELLKKYELASILDYSSNLSKEEQESITKFVEEELSKNITKYQKIIVFGKVVGCYHIEPYQDGVLISILYLEKEVREKHIGTRILKAIIDTYENVYLWVYKENKRAIRLYERLGFRTIQETEMRFLMVHKTQKSKKSLHIP